MDCENDRPKPTSGIVRTIWKSVSPQMPSVRKAFFWIFLNQLANLVEPTIMMLLIDHLTEQSASGKTDKTKFIVMCFGAFLAYLALNLGSRLKNGLVFRISEQIEFDLKVDSMGKALRLPINHYLSENSGKFIGTLTRGIGQYTQVIWMLAFDILPIVATASIAFVALLVIRWQAVVAMAPFLVSFLLLSRYYRRRTAKMRKEKEDQHDQANSHTSEVLDNILSVQAYGQEAREHSTMIDIWGKELDLDIKLHGREQNWGSLAQGLLAAGRLTVIGVCGFAVLNHEITIGKLFFVMNLAGQAFFAAQSLNRMQQFLVRAEEPISRILKLLSVDQENVVGGPRADVPRLKGEIEFDSVSYTYPKLELDDGKDDKPNETVLTAFSFRIKPGSLVGIVGASGGGKTTLLNLMMGFDRPDSGSKIKIDGQEMNDQIRFRLRRHTGLVPSRTELMNATVFENIAYGVPDATDDDVQQAAKLANAHEFIQFLPLLYQEKIGNHGARLSAGQQQRICLARALVRQPSILVLDEATMHLDAENALHFKKTVDALHGKCTVIHATHNIWEIANADLILVIDHGLLEAKGTHSELMARSPFYRRMYEKQSTMMASLARSFSKLDFN